MSKKRDPANTHSFLSPNRRSEFFDIIKSRFSFLLRIGLLTLVFSLPLLLVAYFQNRFSILALSSSQEEGAHVASIRLGYALINLLF